MECQAKDETIKVVNFSSPEHNMLKVSSCDCQMSVVLCQHLPCGHSRGHISSSINLKFGQSVCLDEIAD